MRNLDLGIVVIMILCINCDDPPSNKCLRNDCSTNGSQ